jgi:hypothetical protein
MSTPFETRPPAVEVMRRLGLDPDPWQVQLKKYPKKGPLEA